MCFDCVALAPQTNDLEYLRQFFGIKPIPLCESLNTVQYYTQSVIQLPEIRVNKTVGMDRDVFTYIADMSEKTDTLFNDVLNDLCRDGLDARKNREE